VAAISAPQKRVAASAEAMGRVEKRGLNVDEALAEAKHLDAHLNLATRRDPRGRLHAASGCKIHCKQLQSCIPAQILRQYSSGAHSSMQQAASAHSGQCVATPAQLIATQHTSARRQQGRVAPSCRSTEARKSCEVAEQLRFDQKTKTCQRGANRMTFTENGARDVPARLLCKRLDGAVAARLRRLGGRADASSARMHWRSCHRHRMNVRPPWSVSADTTTQEQACSSHALGARPARAVRHLLLVPLAHEHRVSIAWPTVLCAAHHRRLLAGAAGQRRGRTERLPPRGGERVGREHTGDDGALGDGAVRLALHARGAAL
jgi:hypothetical protein